MNNVGSDDVKDRLSLSFIVTIYEIVHDSVKIFFLFFGGLFLILYLCTHKEIKMKILFPERIDEFARSHPDAKDALERWSRIMSEASWQHHAELKQSFPSADYVGNNRYVFNIKGNNYRTVVMIVFFAGTAAIRFIGTHAEYDKIKDIKSI